MRKALCALMIPLFFLTGCGGGRTGESYDRAMAIRAEYEAAQTFSGTMETVADYGQRVYDDTISFASEGGVTTLTLTAPENVAGITAVIRDGETELSYDGASLDTGSLTDTGISPVSALSQLIDCVRSGYIAGCGEEELDGVTALRVRCCDPSLAPGTGIETILWFDEGTHALLRAEISQDGTRVLQCTFSAFTFG